MDVGSGLGGPARCFALEFGWQVTALELTRELHEAGRQLTEWLGASDKVTHIVGDFPLEPTSGTWDAIVLLHVDMHLDDKLAAYRRCAGLLRAGGRVLWHDWLAGPGGELLLPVPWADEGEETTALSTPEQFRRDLADAGLHIARFETIEARTIDWFERSRQMVTGALARADGSRRKELRQRLAEIEGVLRNLDEERLVPFVAEARLAR